MNIEIKDKKVFYFATALIFCECLYCFIMIITNSNWISTYFSNDPTNTAMDYFNMLAEMQDNTPPGNYPAMCFAFWKVMYCLLPESIHGAGGFYLRNELTAQLGYMIFMVFTIILIYELFHSFEIGGKIENILLSIGLILSGPMVFTYERGNIIILSFLFLLLFVRLYDSENKYLRILSYVFLAISASIKIYPALFGIMILTKKRYKEAGIAVLLGILIFSAPFFLFNGIETMKNMVNGIFRSTSIQGNFGVGYNFSFSNLVKICGKLCAVEINKVPVVFIIFAILYCLLILLLSKKDWQRLFMVSLLCVWIPGYSYTYVLILFIIPFLYYLKEENNDNYFNYFYSVLFVIIFIPIALPDIEAKGSFKFPMSFPTVIINAAILLMSILILIEQVGIKMRGGDIKNEKKRLVLLPFITLIMVLSFRLWH